MCVKSGKDVQLFVDLGQITVKRDQHWFFLGNSEVENSFKRKLKGKKWEVWRTNLKWLFHKFYQDSNTRKVPISEPSKSAFH